jgi:hypothetical protein
MHRMVQLRRRARVGRACTPMASHGADNTWKSKFLSIKYW